MEYKVLPLDNGRWAWEIHQDGQDPIGSGKEFSSEGAANRNLLRHLDPTRHVMVKPAQSEGKAPKTKAKKKKG